MNSLRDLNSHSRKGVAYNDTGTYTVAWTATGTNVSGPYGSPPVNKEHTIFTHRRPTAGNTSLVTANTVSMIVPIDFTTLSSVSNSISVTYALYTTNPTGYRGNIFVPNTLPTGTTVTRADNVTIDGIGYNAAVTISGISSVDAWNAVRLPIMDHATDNAATMQPTIAGNVFFTYANGVTTSFTFRNIIVLSSNSKISNASPETYNINQPKVLINYPTIWANIPTANVYVTPSVSSAVDKITSAGTGGTTAYDQYSKTLTITGTGAQINTHLGNLQVTPATDRQDDIFLNYTLRVRSTAAGGFNSNVSQYGEGASSSNVAIHAVSQSFTANAFNRTRTFDETGYGLLFPDHVPVVANVGTGNYTISMTLNSDSGIIGLGESFTTPVGWTSANLNYSYTGNLTTTNTTLSSLRYFPRPGSASKPVVSYTQQYNGTVQFTSSFALSGQANAKVIGGTTRYNAYEQQNITDLGTAEFYPSVFSNYVVMYRGINGGVDNAAVRFTAPDANWTTSGNAVIYRQFTPAADLSTHITNLSAARTANVTLGANYVNDIAVEQKLGIESYVTGTDINGGKQYTAVKPIRISPLTSVSITNTYSVPWDWRVPLDIVITDYDTTLEDLYGPSEYTANIRQLDFATQPGWLVFTNNNSVNYGNITVTGLKSNINAVLANVSYYRPIDTVYNPFKSLYFDGRDLSPPSQAYLSVPYSSDFEFGSGDYTIEFWMYSFDTKEQDIMAIPGKSNSISQNYFYRDDDNTLRYYSSSNGSSWDIAEYLSMGEIAVNTWYHVAVSRSGVLIKLFLNGAVTNTINFSGTFAGSYDRVRIGDNGGALNFNGRLTNIRVVKGTAVYTAAFTPPPGVLPITNTKLLIDSYPVVDKSPGNLTITTVGTVTSFDANATVPTFSGSSYNLQYTQSKITGNITSAMTTANIVVNNQGSRTVGVSFPSTANLALLANTYITGTVITDVVATEANATVGNIGKTYSFSLTQSNPIGYFYINGSNVGTRFTTSGNITNINATIANIGFDCNVKAIGTTTTFTSNVVRQISGQGNAVISSNTCIATTRLQSVGEPIQGGYYAGNLALYGGAVTHYLVVAPRLTTGDTSDYSAGNIAWITPPDDLAPSFPGGGSSFTDGDYNTQILANIVAVSYGAAKYCNDLVLNGCNDWYLPAPVELITAYQNLKPTTAANDTATGAWAANGSVWSSSIPGQTISNNFKDGGSQAFVSSSAGFYYQYYLTSFMWFASNTSNGPFVVDFYDGSRVYLANRTALAGQANCAIRPMRRISV
jgi:hypothetical protein